MNEVRRYWVPSGTLADQSGFHPDDNEVVQAWAFDRVTADADRLRAELECSRGDFAQLERISECLQARLNTADQAVDEMVTLLNLAENILSEHRQISPGYDWISNTQQDREEMRKQIAEYLTNMCAPNDGQCQLPQSCTSNCPCKADDIPDFTPGNGNKARRRAAAIEALKPENQRIMPVDPFTICLNCFGAGTICTGILEASSTICNRCNGTGREQP